MRIRHKKEYANVAAPWASSALPAAIPSTMPSVGMGRATLHLSRASRQLLGSSWDPAAFEIRPTAAAADPRGSTHKSSFLCAAMVAGCRVFGCSLDVWYHWPALRRFGSSGEDLGGCHGSVDTSSQQHSQQRIGEGQESEAGGQRGACEHAHGGGTLRRTGEGNWTATHQHR